MPSPAAWPPASTPGPSPTPSCRHGGAQFCAGVPSISPEATPPFRQLPGLRGYLLAASAGAASTRQMARFPNVCTGYLLEASRSSPDSKDFRQQTLSPAAGESGHGRNRHDPAPPLHRHASNWAAKVLCECIFAGSDAGAKAPVGTRILALKINSLDSSSYPVRLYGPIMASLTHHCRSRYGRQRDTAARVYQTA